MAVCVAAWLSLSLLAQVARAAEPVDPFTEPDESQLFRAEERMVTVAGRFAQTVDQAASIVTVVTDREIRERGYRTLGEVLSSLPGVYVTWSSEGRRLAWFRGVISADNNKFLLLVDGVPWADGVYTHAWIDEYLPLSDVRQVEVVKGPGSLHYGSSAFAGVVNVVTYRPDDLQGGFLRAEAGSFGRRGGALVFADRLPARGVDAGVSAYVRALETDGDGVDLSSDGQRNVSGAAPRRAIGAGLSLDLGDLNVRFDHVDYRHAPLDAAQYDALAVLLSDPDSFGYAYHNEFLAARWGLHLGRALELTPHAWLQRYENPGIYGSFGEWSLSGDDAITASQVLVEAEKRSTRGGVGLDAQIHAGASNVSLISLGAEQIWINQLEDRVFLDGQPLPTTGAFHATPARLWDLFGLFDHHFSPLWWLELNAGARVELRGETCLAEPEACGPMPAPWLLVSPRAGVLLLSGSRSAVKLLYGRAFRAPDARELLVEVGRDADGKNLFTASNRELDPELIDTVELEATGADMQGSRLRLAGYYSSVRQEIDKESGGDPATVLGDVYYANLAGASVFGAEAEAERAFGPVELSASYAFTHARDRATGALQYGFPPHMGHARATWAVVEGLRISALADVFSARPRAAWSPDAGLSDAPAYGLLHLALATDALAHGRVRIDLSVRNLLDTPVAVLPYRDEANALNDAGEAASAYDLQTEGRSALVGVELAF